MTPVPWRRYHAMLLSIAAEYRVSGLGDVHPRIIAAARAARIAAAVTVTVTP